MANNNSSISAQVSITGGFFSSLEGIHALLSATTTDNVPNQAVLAIERMGGHLEISPKLQSDGVRALNGNDSVPIQNSKLVVGLRSGLTIKLLRESSPCLKLFLFISALKAGPYNEKDISGILHSFLLESGVSRLTPTSPEQLLGVVKLVSGHAQKLQPAAGDSIDIVSTAVINAAARSLAGKTCRGLFDTLPSSVLSKILFHTFDSLLNDDVKKASLYGSTSGIFIASLFHWLIPESVCILWENDILFGDPSAKIWIHLRPSEKESTWRHEEWQEGKEPHELIVVDDRPIITDQHSGIIPWMQTAHWMTSMLCYLPQNAGDVVGQLSGVIFQLLIEFGNIQNGFQTYRIPLKSLASATTLSRLNCFMEYFGWDKESFMTDQNDIYEDLCDRAKRCAFWESDWTIEELRGMMKKAVNKVHPNLRGSLPQEWNIEEILDYGFLIGSSALAVFASDDIKSTSSCYTPKIHFAAMQNRHFTIQKLLSKHGMVITEFRRLVLSVILGCPSEEIKTNDLICSKEGVVLYPALIFGPTINPRDAVKFYVKAGEIRFEEQLYSVVRDATPRILDPEVKNSDLDQLQAYKFGVFGRKEYLGIEPKADWKCTYHGHETIFHPEHDVLMLQTFLNFDEVQGTTGFSSASIQSSRTSQESVMRGSTQSFRRATAPSAPSIKRGFSWIDAIEGLSTARHLTPADTIPIRMEETIADRLDRDGIINSIFWVAPSSVIRVKRTRGSRTRLIACTKNDTMLRLFHVGQSVSAKFIYIMANGASILRAITESEEITREGSFDWMIVL
jgi:hypothetical protein